MATKTTRTDTTETTVTEAIPGKAAKRRGPSVNRVSLIGRIATDPVLRYTPNGTAVTNFRLANNGSYQVQFHTIVAWRGLAEIAAKYLSKGRLVYVSGHLSSRTWTGSDGQDRWALEIIAEDIQFLSAKAAGYRRPSPPSALASPRLADAERTSVRYNAIMPSSRIAVLSMRQTARMEWLLVQAGQDHLLQYAKRNAIDALTD